MQRHFELCRRQGRAPEAVLRTQAVARVALGGGPAGPRGAGPRRRCAVSTSPSGDEAGASDGCMRAQGFSVCAVVLGTLEMVKRAFNGWLFVGVGL